MKVSHVFCIIYFWTVACLAQDQAPKADPCALVTRLGELLQHKIGVLRNPQMLKVEAEMAHQDLAIATQEYFEALGIRSKLIPREDGSYLIEIISAYKNIKSNDKSAIGLRKRIAKIARSMQKNELVDVLYFDTNMVLNDGALFVPGKKTKLALPWALLEDGPAADAKGFNTFLHEVVHSRVSRLRKISEQSNSDQYPPLGSIVALELSPGSGIRERFLVKKIDLNNRIIFENLDTKQFSSLSKEEYFQAISWRKNLVKKDRDLPVELSVDLISKNQFRYDDLKEDYNISHRIDENHALARQIKSHYHSIAREFIRFEKTKKLDALQKAFVQLDLVLSRWKRAHDEFLRVDLNVFDELLKPNILHRSSIVSVGENPFDRLLETPSGQRLWFNSAQIKSNKAGVIDREDLRKKLLHLRRQLRGQDIVLKKMQRKLVEKIDELAKQLKTDRANYRDPRAVDAFLNGAYFMKFELTSEEWIRSDLTFIGHDGRRHQWQILHRDTNLLPSRWKVLIGDKEVSLDTHEILEQAKPGTLEVRPLIRDTVQAPPPELPNEKFNTSLRPPESLDSGFAFDEFPTDVLPTFRVEEAPSRSQSKSNSRTILPPPTK